MAALHRQADPLGARTRRRRELRRRTRRSLGLTVLAVLPGAGLTRTRFRAIGWTLLGLIAAALVVLAVTTVVKGPRSMLDLALRIAISPTLLLVVAGVAVVAGLVWILSIILTNRGSEPLGADISSKLGLRLATGVICLVVAAPVVQTVRYVAIQRELVGTVFAAEGPVPVAGGAVSTQTAKPVQAADPWKNVPRVNMLLIGSDAGSDRTGLRTDSMVVASIDTKTGTTTLISLPRNLERVPFPDDNPLHAYFPNGYYCPSRGVGNECLLNAVWNEALGHKDLFPGDPTPGLTTLKAVIGEITGVKLDYSTIIDLAGFQSLVDAMGGVTVNVTERLPINGYHLSNGGVAGIEGYIEPGVQKLDGFHALWYARSRLLSDDYSRMRRQRCLVGALLNQVNPATMLAKYPELAQVAKQNITTDVSLADLPAWVDLVERIQKGGVRSLTFTVEVINVARPNFPKMRQLVADAINPPAATPTTPGEAGGTSTPPATTPPATSSTTPAPDSTSAVDVKAAC